MKKSGLMILTVEFGKYFAELQGSNAKVWDGEGLPSYEGEIDGIQEKYPDFWAHLIEKKLISEVK